MLAGWCVLCGLRGGHGDHDGHGFGKLGEGFQGSEVDSFGVYGVADEICAKKMKTVSKIGDARFFGLYAKLQQVEKVFAEMQGGFGVAPFFAKNDEIIGITHDPVAFVDQDLVHLIEIEVG